MKNFKKLFPDYNMYSNEIYLMNIVTPSLLREIAQKIPRVIQNFKFKTSALSLDGTMRGICDKVSLYTNNDKTENWGFDYIVRDFDNQVRDFENVKFHKFMDAMIDIGRWDTLREALNEIFEEHDFGYRLTDNPEQAVVSINPTTGLSIDIEEVIVTTAEICEQTTEHIKQAKVQLTRATEIRARKDAVRDCLSGMEALMKHFTNTEDIKDADKVMRADLKKWGKATVIKDGISLWNLFHREYPDIRHGNSNISDLSYEEAIYFIDRILAFVKYISAKVID